MQGIKENHHMGKGMWPLFIGVILGGTLVYLLHAWYLDMHANGGGLLATSPCRLLIINDNVKEIWMLSNRQSDDQAMRMTRGIGIEIVGSAEDLIDRLTEPIILVGKYDDNGIKAGVWQGITSDGRVSCEISYGGGRRNGRYRVLHKSGAVAVESVCRDDIFEGLRTAWDEDGQKTSEGLMVNNKMHGKWLFWNKDGRLDHERSGLYEGGHLQSFLDN